MKKSPFLSIVLAAILLISQSSFSPANPPDLVKDVLHYTNQFRESKRLAALTMNDALNEIAKKHSEDMAKGRVGFGHSGFERRSNQAVKAIKGIHSFAENVAYGPRTGKEVVSLWKNSAGHRENMLGRYRFIGIGIAKNRKGITYYTEVFAN
jgi:uncharacterized protein YkwD